MSEIKILIAETRGGLDGVAQAEGVSIIEHSVAQFEGLGTETSHNFWPANKTHGRAIFTSKSGWIGLAR